MTTAVSDAGAPVRGCTSEQLSLEEIREAERRQDVPRQGPLRSRRWRVWRWLLRTVLAAVVLAVVAAATTFGTCGYAGCPGPAALRAYRPTEGGEIRDEAGRFLGRVSVTGRINLQSVPPVVAQAITASEDRRFLRHRGVDWRGCVRALVVNAVARSVEQGCSTLTMQVARTSPFMPRWLRGNALPRKVLRKVVEVRLAYLLEGTLSKPEILLLYCNAVPFRPASSGIEVASRELFGKSVQRGLTLAEAATLASLTPAPARYDPRRSTRAAVRRRNLVLTLMAREGFISRQRARAVANQPLRLSWRGRPERAATAGTGGSWALDLAREEIRALCGTLGCDPASVRAVVTIDARAQAAAERAVALQASIIQREADAHYRAQRRAAPPVQGALVALDPQSGAVRAIVGGRSYVPGQWNRALLAHRQVGSTFKPFAYAAALEQDSTPDSYVEDAPISVRVGARLWEPRNYRGDYAGWITLRQAVAESRNAAAVRVALQVGTPRVAAVARRMGVASPLPLEPSLALGVAALSPRELVSAYAPFVNGGYKLPTPRLLLRLETADRRVLWTAPAAQPGTVAPAASAGPTAAARERVLDPEVSRAMLEMLRAVVDEGTGRVVRNLGVDAPVAGKTGTTNDGADVWFVGATPTLLAGVWFGFDKPAPLSRDPSGARLAAPAWARFYRAAWNGRDEETEELWPAPMLITARGPFEL